MSKKRPKGRPEPLGTLLHASFRGSTLGERLKDLEIWQSWDRVVGPAIAKRTRPLRISGGVLTVLVGSAAWMQQLTFMKSDLRLRLNSCLGEERISEILLKSGSVTEPEAEKNSVIGPYRELTEQQRLLIEEQIKAVPDPELKEQFKKLMESHYRSTV